MHQNWMRDYDPTTGRYIQADPLGLVDGASVYGYALQNPGRWTDRRGEDSTWWFNRTGGRDPWRDGPTNGNWGGRCWSGGQYSCGPEGMGKAPATDSADECYERHDRCYVACGADQACTSICDTTLADQLLSLPQDPRQWPNPPRRGTEGDTRAFADTAIEWFNDGTIP